MTHEQFEAVCTFEDSLSIGSAVRVRWKNAGYPCDGVGKVSKRLKRTIRVELTEAIRGEGGRKVLYQVATIISVPTLVGDPKGWSFNNRVEPIDGYPETLRA